MLTVALLTGCQSERNQANNNAQPATEPSVVVTTPASEPSATQTPTDAAVPSSAISGVAHIKDVDGYTFDVNYVFAPQTVEQQVASEKPGLNSLVVKEHAELTVANTTAGRDLAFKASVGTVRPQGDPKLALIGLWPPSSPVCTYAVTATQTKAPDAPPCGIVLASTHLPDILGAGQSSTTQTYAGIENAAPGLAHVPDAAVAGVRALLVKPATVVVAYIGGDQDRFANTCPNPDLTAFLKGQWVVNWATYQMYDNGFLPIFSTAPTCATSDFLAQPLPD